MSHVWNVNTEKHVERAVAIGQHNRNTLELVRNWCAHVEFKKQGGGGIIEQETGLPIGPRYLTCPHAAAPGFSGIDLRFLALDFHDRNCVNCSNRKPVGLPNLSILVRERDEAIAAQTAHAGRREAEEAAARDARDSVRQTLRYGLAPSSADVIDQIEELDHRGDGANADRLVETARLAPEVFNPPLVEYAFTLLEGGESWFDDAGLRLLNTLGADRARLTRCALLCIPRHFAAETAAGILLENVELADEALIDGAIPGLISIANPRREPFVGSEPVPITAPLIGVHGAFPATVEMVIRRLLDSSEPYAVGEAARGIAVLASSDSSLPGRFARNLISQLVRNRRLLDASGYYGDGDSDTVNEVRHALALAFEAAPIEIDDLLKAFLLGASEVGEVRVLSAYDAVLRRSRFDGGGITDATRIALKRVVWHATRTDRLEVLRAIEGIISGSPSKLGSLAAEEVEKLIGAAILIQAKLESLDAEPVIHNPTPLAGLERHSRRMTLQTLRRAFIKWAAAGAGTALAAARTYCEILGNLPTDGQDKIKSVMVQNLDRVMETASGLEIALPHLYTAMVGASVVLRASATDAIGGLDHRQQDNLPGLVFEAFMALLNDPYVLVHQQAVHALRRLWSLPDEYRPKVKRTLLAWAIAYASDRAHDRFFIECLDFYIDRYADPSEFSGRLGAWALSVLQQVEPYIVAGEINTFGRVLQNHDDFPELLARLTRDSTAWASRHEELMQALAELSADAVRSKLQVLETLADAQEVQARNIEGLFVELFSRAGAWEAAERLVRTRVAAIPDDAWNRTRKLAVQQIRVAIEFEAALASGSADHVSRLSAEWRRIEEAVEKDRTENEERRDPLRGLSRRN